MNSPLVRCRLVCSSLSAQYTFLVLQAEILIIPSLNSCFRSGLENILISKEDPQVLQLSFQAEQQSYCKHASLGLNILMTYSISIILKH